MIPEKPRLLLAQTAGAVRAHKEWLDNHPNRNQILTGAAIAFLVLFAGFRLLTDGAAFSVPKVNYQPVYALVNDKISQHGAIIVNLPKGEAVQGAMEKVHFEPQIAGTWIESKFPNAVLYKPAAALVLGKHYSVSYQAGKGTITKDFLVDEDPQVVDVFPSADAEAPLSSAITIVFNRPMVPLTTLSELESKDIPVTISPETVGKFKWITTRTLQFIPKATLAGSAHYKVEIKSDFISMDGLPVPAKTYSFTTTQLRLSKSSSGTIGYSEPIKFYFNQPVDLEKTKPEIAVRAVAQGAPVAFIASYGTKKVWDSERRKYREVEDRSVISILPKDSLRGNAHAWEFETSYSATIKTVYPVGGDIALVGSLSAPAVSSYVKTDAIFEAVLARSDASRLVSKDLFDPAGTAVFQFHEDIDIGRSDITAKGLKKITYAKKCVNDKEDIEYSDSCKQTDDKTQLVATFDRNAFGRGEKIPVTFEKIINSNGFQVNSTPIVQTLTVYPMLKVLKSVPQSDARGGSIRELVLCTNVPLKMQEAKEFYQNFKANKYIVFGRWDSPYLLTPNSYNRGPTCKIGEYVNTIHYGLLPLQPYTLSISLEDVFAQKTALSLSFQTEPAPKFYLRLQSLQKIYNVTTPGSTKLTYATENFDYADLHICKVTPEQMVRFLATAPSSVSSTSGGSLACIATKTDRIQLKSDQWVNQYFQVDLKTYFPDPRGQYVISISHPQYKNEDGAQIYGKTYLSVTNLAVVDNRVRWTSYDYLEDVPDLTPSNIRGSVYWISRIGSLAPIPGASISVFRSTDLNKNKAPLALARTAPSGAAGLVEFPLIADVSGAAITAGDDSAVVSRWSDTLSERWWSSAHQNERLYVYTDRPIYRPGQEVFIKGLYRVNYDGVFQVFQGNDIEINVRDSRGKVLLTQKVPVSLYGTFSASVKLPSDGALGNYSISARGGYASFSVEEYAAAAFEATATSDKDEYIAGDSAEISVAGKYYFGVALDGGTLKYSITSQNYYFDRYQDEFFNFGRGWYYCYDCGYGDTYLKSDQVDLREDGKASVTVPLDFEALFKGDAGNSSKIFVFHATLKDKQGRSVNVQRSFIVHRGEYYLGVKGNPSFTEANKPITLRVKTVDVNGKPSPHNGITVTVNKVGWEYNRRQEVDGGYYSRSQRTLSPVMTKTLSTNFAGDYSEAITLADHGEYEISAVGNDSKGNQIKSQSSLYIYGKGTVDTQPTNNATLNLTSEKKDVSMGERAKFIIQNPFPHAKALISIERGRIFSYEVVDIAQSIYEYSFPITEEHVPNVFVSVVLLSPDPAVKYGELEFTVDKKQKQLTIDIQSDKRSYLPGEQVHLTVRTKDIAGAPVSADVSLAVADLSVLALAGNPKKDPLVFFYGNFPLTVSAETNIKNLLEEMPIPTGTKGGGGGSPNDLATHKRGEFKDTAFWQASVVTDASGVAHVSFKLPDNLTRWQIESIGITKDTKVGVKYQEILAQKEVMAVPIKPRFVVPGDEFLLGAKIFNQTQERQSLDISLTSDTLELEDSGRTRKTIAAGETATVYFKVKAPLDKAEGEHTFIFSAKNEAYNDTVEQTISITRNETYEHTATAASTESLSATEYLYLPEGLISDRGGLTIKTSATLAVYVSDALKYLFEYPYGCSEQLASKLSAIAVTKRALAIPNVGTGFTIPKVRFNNTEYTVDEAVAIGLKQIYDNQTVDGGFTYYKGMKSNPYLTIHILMTLADLRDAGYKVDESVIKRASKYMFEGQVSEFRRKGDLDSVVLAAYALSRANPELAGGVAGDAMELATNRFLSDQASSQTLGYFALVAVHAKNNSVKNKVFAALQNRVEIDSRGAYVKSLKEHFSWRHYETTESDTALLIKALAADKREYEETPNLIRWLVASRSSDGSWGSTNTSLHAIDALADYLSWKRETESEFTLETLLDEKQVSSTKFEKSNILETMQQFVPVGSIAPGEMHALTFKKTNDNSLANRFYYDLSLKYYLPVQNIAPRDEGIAITRELYGLADGAGKQPLTGAKVGDVVRGMVTVISPKVRHLVALDVPIPAGFELVNLNLSTEDQANAAKDVGAAPMADTAVASAPAAKPGGMLSSLFASARALLASAGLASSGAEIDGEEVIQYKTLRADFAELHDDRLFLFLEDLPPGTYKYEYFLRATVPGTFSHLPALASEMYFPENFGRTAGSIITVSE